MQNVAFEATRERGIGFRPSSLETSFREIPDTAGFIEFPERIFSSNVFDDFLKDQDLPAAMRQWRTELDFHLVQLDFNLRHQEQYAGVEWFQARIKITGGQGSDAADIADIGPKNEWKESAISGEVKLGFDVAEALGGAMKLIPDEGLDASASVTYTWDPKVATVVSGHAGQYADLTLQRAEGKYIDGGHQILLLVRRPRQVESLTLTLKEARARYDLHWPYSVETFAQGETNIEVRYNASSPE